MAPKKPIMQSANGDMKAYLEEVTPDGVAKIRIEGNDVNGFIMHDKESPSTLPALGLCINASRSVMNEHPEVKTISIEGFVDGKKVYGANVRHDNDWALQITQKPEKEPEPEVNNEPIYIGAGTKEYIENKKMFETNLTPDQKNLYDDIEKLKRDMFKIKAETWGMKDLPSPDKVAHYANEMDRLKEELKQKTETFENGLAPWQKDMQERMKGTEPKDDFGERLERQMDQREADYKVLTAPKSTPAPASTLTSAPDFEVEVHKGAGPVPFNDNVLKAQELMAEMKKLAGDKLPGVNLGHFKNHSGTGNDGLDGRFGKMTHESVKAVEKYLGIDPPTGKITDELVAKMEEKIKDPSQSANGPARKTELVWAEPEVAYVAPEIMKKIEDILAQPSQRIGTERLLEAVGVDTKMESLIPHNPQPGEAVTSKVGMDDFSFTLAADVKKFAPPTIG